MHGLGLIAGINCVGKGTVAKILQHYSDYLGCNLEIASLSSTMRQLRSTNDNGLTNMDETSRANLRMRAMETILDYSKTKPVLLDMHFLYEDGEQPDYRWLRERVSQVIMVKSPPERIYGNLSRGDVSHHPNRQSLRHRGISSIREFQDQELMLSRRFAQESAGSVGYVEITNSLRNFEDLAYAVARVTPAVMANFCRKPSIFEGNSYLSPERR